MTSDSETPKTLPDTTGSSAAPGSSLPQKLPPHKRENWQGYSLEEIRYQRAYTLARIEIISSRLKQNSSSFLDGSPGSSRSLLGRMLSAFSYVDLAVMAWKIGSKVWQTTRIFKR